MARKVWAVLQQRDGKLHRGSWEAIAAAQRLAQGGEVVAVLLGSAIEPLAREVAGRAKLTAVLCVEHETLANYTPGGYGSALMPLAGEAKPDFLLFPHTYQTVEFMPRLAHSLGAGVLTEAIGFVDETSALVWTRPVLGGKLHARVTVRGSGPVCVSLQAGAFPAEALETGSAELRRVVPSAVQVDREILGIEEAGGGSVDLSKAERIVAIGRGVGSEDKLGPLRELAQLLGAEIGASRPVIDSGWLPREHQVGSSGQTVAPKLYLALGISGAIQHLVGMTGASTIVAVNKDAGAPIFSVAHYGVVADLHEFVPALIEALKSRP
jgi:electron transfer flavoprotein alpha subunit